MGFVSDTKKCSNTDGTANVDAAWTCGTSTAVAVANGKVCVDTSGTGVAHEPLCAGNKADGTNAAGTACSCGTTGTGTTLVASGAAKFCRVESNRGYVSATVKCSILVGATAVNAACTCGTTTPAAAASGKFCYVDAAAKGWVSALKQCSAFNSNQGDGTTINAQACSCGTLAATTCNFCWRSTATGAGELGTAAWAACATTDGTAPHLKGPQKCKCGTGAV